MKSTRRILFPLLLLLTLGLGACDDPYDRIQGEPGEDGVYADESHGAHGDESESHGGEGEGETSDDH